MKKKSISAFIFFLFIFASHSYNSIAQSKKEEGYCNEYEDKYTPNIWWTEAGNKIDIKEVFGQVEVIFDHTPSCFSQSYFLNKLTETSINLKKNSVVYIEISTDINLYSIPDQNINFAVSLVDASNVNSFPSSLFIDTQDKKIYELDFFELNGKADFTKVVGAFFHASGCVESEYTGKIIIHSIKIGKCK